MSGEEHEVLAIVDSRRTDSGETEYRIRWKNFNEDGDTWQSGNTIEHTLAFAEYQDKLKKQGNSNVTPGASSENLEQSIQGRFNLKNFSDAYKFKEFHPCPMDLVLPEPPKDEEIGFPKGSSQSLKRKRVGEEGLEQGSVIFYYRETKNTLTAKAGEPVKLFEAVSKNFYHNYSPRMLIGRTTHGDMYERRKSEFKRPNIKLRIRVSKKTESRALKFFKCLKNHPKLGLFMHDFKEKRLLVYLHPPEHCTAMPKEMYATQVLEAQRHELNFMLGRFKHNPARITLARQLARLLYSLPKPASARIHLIRDHSERMTLTFGREIKVFDREHVANFLRQKGELLLTIAGEIVVLTKNERCSVTIMSTRRYEQKLQHSQVAIYYNNTNGLGDAARAVKDRATVMRYLTNLINNGSQGEEELKRLYAKMRMRECKILFSDLRTSGARIDPLSSDICECLEKLKYNEKVKFLGKSDGVDILLYHIH